MTSQDQQHGLDQEVATKKLQLAPSQPRNAGQTQVKGQQGSRNKHSQIHGARKPKNGLPRDSKLACLIADRLSEPKVQLLHRVVRILGNKTAWRLFQETLQIEQEGGLFVTDSNVSTNVNANASTHQHEQNSSKAAVRRRTSGGVFLGLVKQHATKEEHQRIYEVEVQKKKAARKRIRFQKKKKLEKTLAGLGFEKMEIEDGDGKRAREDEQIPAPSG